MTELERLQALDAGPLVRVQAAHMSNNFRTKWRPRGAESPIVDGQDLVEAFADGHAMCADGGIAITLRGRARLSALIDQMDAA